MNVAIAKKSLEQDKFCLVVDRRPALLPLGEGAISGEGCTVGT